VELRERHLGAHILGPAQAVVAERGSKGDVCGMLSLAEAGSLGLLEPRNPFEFLLHDVFGPNMNKHTTNANTNFQTGMLILFPCWVHRDIWGAADHINNIDAHLLTFALDVNLRTREAQESSEKGLDGSLATLSVPMAHVNVFEHI
jgi:hypothetical protein